MGPQLRAGRDLRVHRASLSGILATGAGRGLLPRSFGSSISIAPSPYRCPRSPTSWWPALLLLIAACGPSVEAVTADNRVGDDVCVSCHVEQAGFLTTAHRLTSAPAAAGAVLGSVEPGRDVLPTANPAVHFRMERRSDGVHQVAVIARAADTIRSAERIDLITGSGRKGQSYAYWRDERLYQLPVSYWTALDDWIVSPGFGDGGARWNRPINARCLECHATYVTAGSDRGATNHYEPATLATGIGCEVCHGGGRTHVERQRHPLRRLLGQAIANPARLRRERQIDGCALCHGGVGESLQPPFSYPPGAVLAEYLHLPPPDPLEPVDVHGNQVALLMQSPCFQQSPALTCSTCHDVHDTQRAAESYAPTCLTCHTVDRCGLFPERGAAIAGGCPACHMPELPARTVVAQRGGEPVRPLVRTHRIGVYPEPEAQ